MDCKQAERLVQLDLDGEIDPEEQLNLALHVAACRLCKRLHDQARWVHSGVRRRLAESVESAESVPCEALKARVVGQLREGEFRAAGRPGRWAVAAVVGLGVVAYGVTKEPAEDPLLEDAVVRHSSNLPPEVRASTLDQSEVDVFLRRNLSFPVRMPELRDGAKDGSIRLIGARLASLRDRDAAYVMYDHHGAKLSLFAAPELRPVRSPEGFKEHRMGDRTMLVGQRRGYNVVSWRDRDQRMVYSLVSDVDQNELLRLAAQADHRY